MIFFRNDHVEEHMKEIAIRLVFSFFIYLYIPNHSWRFCPNKPFERLAYSSSFVPTPQFIQRVRWIARRGKKSQETDVRRHSNEENQTASLRSRFARVVLARRTDKNMRRTFAGNRRTTLKKTDSYIRGNTVPLTLSVSLPTGEARMVWKNANEQRENIALSRYPLHQGSCVFVHRFPRN